MTDTSPYVGRFAPSPTGPLHFGSLLAAIASYLEARRHAGRWLVRIEDIDPPREQPGAARMIIDALDAYGFTADGPVIFQNSSEAAHRLALEQLVTAGHTYRCGCSRKDLADEPVGPLGSIYPGTCRNGSDAGEFAVRLRTDDVPVTFDDRLQGPQSHRLESESGDFIICRRDGLIAYHLAVVVDDFEQQVTEIVRGIDLMPSTARQIRLQQLLDYPTPSYAHIPVAVHPDGDKLSKATGAAAVPLDRPGPVLHAGLRVLRQDPPANLASAGVAGIWTWAMEHWDISRLAYFEHVPAYDAAMAGTKNRLS